MELTSKPRSYALVIIDISVLYLQQIISSNVGANHALHRDLEEAILLLEKKEEEISRLKDTVEQYKKDNEKQREILGSYF